MAISNLSSGEILIGIIDIFNEGQWSYASDGQPITYTNWNRGEPNDYNGEHVTILVILVP